MIACPSCGFEASNDFAFCPKCATKLAAPLSVTEERKVVTTLFCDLVAFTAMSEQADPEDVDALLGDYFARATRVIESHGGTVEKFIGDAVVGVFGVPAAHEDDPERAVRAGLRIVEALGGMARPSGSPLQARCGINTGEALVRLDVDPASGRGFLTGDAVNTAARLQAAAPPAGVVVGALTHQLTAHAFVCEGLPPVSAKGKAEPVPAWLVLKPVARTGEAVDASDATPFVGRELELAHLKALFGKAASSSAPQFALVVGEPGIGKSRLVAELSAYVDVVPELVTWRQGRCLPYGEGVTFWALSEIVKAHAGILETDHASVVDEKLATILPDGVDQAWFRQRLRALLGFEAPQASREENFAAWLRFIEYVSASGPAVFVFEDLHWADEALLAFLEHLSSHVSEVPLMVVATARPELFEEHAGFMAAGTRVNRIGLEALSGEETERLVTSLLSGPAGSAEAAAGIIGRCAGNPFFAEESARLYAQTARVSLPTSVQAVIAARLDAIEGSLKAVLADASVAGEVFWDGLLADVGEREPEHVADALRELVAKQLVRRVRSSSMAGEGEFAFAHALARDVAYGQLPRAARARKHAAVAAWIAKKAGDRSEDLSEVLAHHYVTGMELAEAAGRDDLAAELRRPALDALRVAGQRALSLDIASAGKYISRALELAGPADALRPRLLFLQAEVLSSRSQLREAIVCLEEAIPAARASGDVRLAATAMALLGRIYDDVGGGNGQQLLDDAVMMLESEDGPSSELLQLMAELVIGAVWGNQPAGAEQGFLLTERAAAVSRDLGIPLPPEVLGSHASLLADIGAPGWEEEFARAIEAARRLGLARSLWAMLHNRGESVLALRGPTDALAALGEFREFVERVGAEVWQTDYRSVTALVGALLGRWDDALTAAHAIRVWAAGQDEALYYIENGSLEVVLLSFLGQMRGLGELADAVDAAAWDSDLQCAQLYGRLSRVVAHGALGRSEIALSAVRDWCARQVRVYGDGRNAVIFPQVMRVCAADGDVHLVAELAETLEPAPTCNRLVLGVAAALVSEGTGESAAAAAGFADAAAGWHDFGVPYEEAQALLGQGRCLVALGRTPEAAAPLAAAREIFERLGAKPALGETNELLSRITSA